MSSIISLINRMVNIRMKERTREALDGYIMALPWLIGFSVFFFLPIIWSLIISFLDWNILYPSKWTGVSNYVKLFNDEIFAKSMVNTVYYAGISVPLQIVLALFIAFLLTRDIKGKTIFKSIYFMPSVIAGVAVALIWKLMFQGDFGIINNLLGYIGIDGPLWLDSPSWSKPALILMSTWQVGTIMIIYIAAIQNIPKELYEAAKIDGAHSLTQFIRITIPLISPVIFFTLIIRTIDSFKIFSEVYALTFDNPNPPGGPAQSTLMLVVYLYEMAFSVVQMGYASTLAWFLLVCVLALTMIHFWLSKRWVYYD